jgi:hypothetical protein
MWIAIFDPINIKKFLSLTLLTIFGHQNPGFGTKSESGSAIIKNAGSGSALNQCGSTTLVSQ